jgi:hypothetical protein
VARGGAVLLPVGQLDACTSQTARAAAPLGLPVERCPLRSIPTGALTLHIEASDASKRRTSRYAKPGPQRNRRLYIAVGCAALIAVALVLGSFVDPLVGVALLVGAVVGGFVWEVSTKDPDRRRPLQEAASEARWRRPTTRARVLVIANRRLHGEELRAELRRHAVTGAEVHIVAPILCSRAHYIASDVDPELEEARNRLSAALAWAESEGVAVTGKVGRRERGARGHRGRTAPVRRR